MSKKLLCCPFCGAEGYAAYKTNDLGDQKHHVFCQASCGGWVRDQVSEKAAIKAWNRRAANLSEGDGKIDSKTPARPVNAGSMVPAGFISWAGSDTAPVEDGENVDLQFRDGDIHYQCMAGIYSWRNRGMPDDIVAYKRSGPETPWTWSDDELPPVCVPVLCIDPDNVGSLERGEIVTRDEAGDECWGE